MLFCIFSGFGFAQNPYIRHLTTYDGLPSNTVYQIYQDQEKFMWLTTDAGVVRYDGSNFINYRKKDGLSSNEIIRMREDMYGRIWLFNYNAFTNFYYKGRIYNERNSPFLNAMIGKGFILDMYQYNNKLIFYNLQCELFVIDSNNVVYRKKLFKNEPSLPLKWNTRESVRVCFTEMKSGSVLRVWTNYGIYEIRNVDSLAIPIKSEYKVESVYPIKGNKYLVKTTNLGIFLVDENFKFIKLKFDLEESSVRFMMMDHMGYIWVSSFTDGVYCYNGSTLVYKIDVKKALGLFQDIDKNIWISSQNNGVHVLKYDLLSCAHFNNEYLGVYMPQLIAFSSFDGVWCSNGESLSLISKNKIYKNLFHYGSLRSDIIYSFPTGQLLLGGKSSSFSIIDKTHISSTLGVLFKGIHKYEIPIKSITFSKRRNGLLIMYDQNRVISLQINEHERNLRVNYLSERINKAFFDKYDELIVNGKENLIYDGKHLFTSSSFERFNGGVITDYVVINDSSDMVLIDGESLFIRSGGKSIDILKGFKSEYLSHIRKLIFANSSMFFSTNSYIFRILNPLDVFKNKNIIIEPISIKFNSINDILFYNDTLYVATNDGMSMLSDTYLKTKNSNAPRPYLRQVIIDYADSLKNVKQIKLIGKKIIHISIGKIDNSFSPIIFHYTLIGYDHTWRLVESDKLDIIYQNLPQGEYVLKIKARKSNSDWSEPLEIPIIIKPTLYEYPLFWFLMSAAFIIILLVLYMKIKNIRMKKAQASHQMIVLEQKALLSMMNPHFIFNSLGSIQNYLMRNKVGESILYLTQFSRLIRQNLNAVKLTMISLDEEIERLNNYLELEQIRLEKIFDYYIEFDHVLEEDHYYIPSMMIQPFVENAIWHGISNLDYKGEVSLKVSRYNEKLIEVIIKDNGQGISKADKPKTNTENHLHIGMNMTRRRLSLLSKKYEVHAKMNISRATSNPDCPGTKITIYLPYVIGTSGDPEDDNEVSEAPESNPVN